MQSSNMLLDNVSEGRVFFWIIIYNCHIDIATLDTIENVQRALTDSLLHLRCQQLALVVVLRYQHNVGLLQYRHNMAQLRCCTLFDYRQQTLRRTEELAVRVDKSCISIRCDSVNVKPYTHCNGALSVSRD